MRSRRLSPPGNFIGGLFYVQNYYPSEASPGEGNGVEMKNRKEKICGQEGRVKIRLHTSSAGNIQIDLTRSIDATENINFLTDIESCYSK